MAVPKRLARAGVYGVCMLRVASRRTHSSGGSVYYRVFVSYNGILLTMCRRNSSKFTQNPSLDTRF